MHRAALAVLAATLSACIAPIGIPAARIDGGVSPRGEGSLRAGTHVVGYRLDRNAEFDIGAGYTRTATTFDPMTSIASGFYIDGSWLHKLGPSTRLSIGPGIAMLFRGEHDDLVPVAYARLGVEAFSPIKAHGTSDDWCGTTTGTWWGQLGIGGYVDVQKPVTESGMAVVAGITGRLPAFGGVALFIPYCK